MKRISMLAALVAVLLSAAACQTIRPTGAPSGRTPVVFVHGWNANETTWDTAVAQFEAAGYTSGDITVLYYDSSLSAHDAAALLATEVDQLRAYTGRPKVDIVSHSFGSMVTKSCIELGGCAGRVNHWMSLAGADNGTTIAGLCGSFQASCADMSGQSSTIADLQAAWPQISAQHVQVAVPWSVNDGVISPATNSQNPSPAVNVRVADTLSHNQLPTDAGVLAETLRFLAH